MPEENIEEFAEVALEAAEDESREHGHRVPWLEWATLSTMLMALFSVIGGLLAGKTGNEAIIDRQMQLQELVQLNRMDLEAEVMLTRLAVINSSNLSADPALLQRIATRTKAIEGYTHTADEDEDESATTLAQHELFAIATTILSVAITLTGMAVIVRRRSLWFGGIGISIGGAAVLVYGVARMLAI
jgi:hypothetical protein